jgi:TPR repeat protein
MRFAAGLGLFMSLAGCAQLGTPSSASLPRDVHARPDPREVAEHPCRYGDFSGCVAKCEADDAQACNAAGVMFEFDSGIETNPALASGFYNRACTSNYAPGCNNLAWLYLRGSGVPQDQPHAMLLFMAAFDAAKLACLQRGDASGCLLAGEILYEDHAKPADGETAVAFFRRACAAGDEHGCQLAQDEE